MPPAPASGLAMSSIRFLGLSALCYVRVRVRVRAKVKVKVKVKVKAKVRVKVHFQVHGHDVSG